MQKLDRLSKMGIVAIIVVALLGGAGVWWWSKQPLEPAKADPPVTTPVSAPVSATSQAADPEQVEIEKAFQAFLAYQDASMEVTRTASDEALTRMNDLSTQDGPQRHRDADLVRQLREDDVRVESGAPRMVGRYTVSDVDLTSATSARLTLTTCWDHTSVRTRNGESVEFGRMLPVMHRVEDEWLVHDLTTERVDSCSS